MFILVVGPYTTGDLGLLTGMYLHLKAVFHKQIRVVFKGTDNMMALMAIIHISGAYRL